jgi:fatty acid synthase, animal type
MLLASEYFNILCLIFIQNFLLIRLYNNGVELPINKLYPSVEFPVSRGTAMISPQIRWDHSEDWFVSKFDSDKTKKFSERQVVVMLSEKDYEYMDGHSIDGESNLMAFSS